ncbi:MAG: hypothetical protein WCL00_09635, partial [Bacteroidota bacterium]
KTTPVITVKTPGNYSLTVTDRINGCSATALAATIYAKPDLSLFPTGCDSILCNTDTLHMYIPMPLNALPPFNTYPASYPVITWYDNGNYATPIASGQSFNLVYPSSGSHQISVVVQNIHGCADTAGVFCLKVLCGTPTFEHCPTGPIMLACNAEHPTSADALGAAGAIIDSCPGPITINVVSGGIIPLAGCFWTETFTITATDACGHTVICVVTYIWKEDHTPPVFAHCPPATIDLGCNPTHPTQADALVAVGPVTDNCPGTPTITVIDGGVVSNEYCMWTETFTVIAMDSCGNHKSCDVNYQWKEDTNPPVFVNCPVNPINLGCNPQHPNTDMVVLEYSATTDNCNGTVLIQVLDGGTVQTSGCGWSETFTLTATDACGNSSTCSVVYIWKEDHTPPVFAHCPVDAIILPCNAAHPTGNDALAVAGDASDNCPEGLTVHVVEGNITETTNCGWTETFSIIATDGCGNSTTCHVTYNWKEDHTPPVFAHCPAHPVLLPCNSPRPTIPDALNLIGNISDNCPGDEIMNTYDSGPVAVTGCDWMESFTTVVTDGCGNTSTCIVTFKWTEDHTPPAFAHCPAAPITLACNATHPTAADAIVAAGQVTDNCPGMVYNSDCLPPSGGEYDGIFTLNYGAGLKLRFPILGDFSDCYPPPSTIGQSVIHSFSLASSYEVSEDGGATWQFNTSPAQTTIKITKIGENESGSLFSTEMLALDISGGTLPEGIMLRESPTLKSSGETRISLPDPITGGYHIDSFFDIFTEITVNRGITWLPADKSGRVILKNAVTVVITGGVPTPSTGCGWTSTFTLTATDGCGNISLCHVTYNWKEDHTPPTFAHCPSGPIILPLNSSHPTIEQALLAAGQATDNCPGAVNISVLDGGAIVHPGCIWTETFTLTATDACGNQTICSVSYTWEMVAPVPVLTGPQTMCLNNTGSYYALGGQSNYVWSVSSGGQVLVGGTGSDMWIGVKWTGTGAQWVSVNYTS